MDEHSMDQSFESVTGSMGRSPSMGHRRSLSDPSPAREVIVRVPAFLKTDAAGVLWRKRAVINEDFLPKDVGRRTYIGKSFMDLGYGDHESYEDTQPFLLSLEKLVRPEDVDFVLDSNVWNFLMASWVMDSRLDPKFDFTLSVNIRNKLIKRRADLQLTGGHQGKSVDDYGREIIID